MIVVGLTGGIGSGKSTVSRLLAARGAVVLDADQHAREVVARGTSGLAAVVAEFGESVLTPGGDLDREALGQRVFPDPEALARLNAIVHPRVGALSEQRRLEAVESGAHVIVHDVPLLAENGLQGLYDVVVVVDCDPQTQLRRLVDVRGMTEADASARMARQSDRAARLAVADVVLTNDGTLEELESQVDALWRDLEDGASASKE